jgi:hypothetical protein
MRKVLWLAAMLAMVLAAAAPALAQQIGGEDQYEEDEIEEPGDNVQLTAVCQNVIGWFQASAAQNAEADADATGGDNAASVAEIAQEQNVSVSQVNECLNAFAAPAGATPTATATATATAGGDGGGGAVGGDGGGGAGGAGGGATAPSRLIAESVGWTLPPTGGASLIALGAAALLVAGGLLARRIAR